MEQNSADNMVQALRAIAADMVAAQDTLNALDGAIGDGDLGITMTLGFRAIERQLSTNDYHEMQEVLRDCGMAFADNAASTFGALMATMFTRAARAVKGYTKINSVEVVAILQAAVEGVQKRGNASLGDKTVLDALIPAVEACKQASDTGQSILVCINAGLEAAKEGAEKTVKMKGRAGRAGWLGERTIGEKDPGAAAFVLLLESASNYLAKNTN